MNIIPDMPVRHRETAGEVRLGGHKLLCPYCGTFQIHRADLEGEPETELAIRLTCTSCAAVKRESSERFVFRAGQWIPEEIVTSLDTWALEMAKAAKKGLETTEKPAANLALTRRVGLGWLRRRKNTDANSDDVVGIPETGSKQRFAGIGLFVLSILGLFMVTLVLAAYVGVRVEFLSGLWMEWPGDAVKVVLGIIPAIFFVWLRVFHKKVGTDVVDANPTRSEVPLLEPDRLEPKLDVDLSRIKGWKDALEVSDGDFDKATKLLKLAHERNEKK